MVLSVDFIWTPFNRDTVESMYTQLRLKARLLERNYCLSLEVSAFEH
jgi:hypothetical protein